MNYFQKILFLEKKNIYIIIVIENKIIKKMNYFRKTLFLAKQFIYILLIGDIKNN